MDIGIKIIIAVVVILVLIGIKMVCDEKARRKRMREFLINSWGKSADRNYSEEQWNAIVSYYKVLEKKAEESQKHEFVDDITWNDLDMDKVYQVSYTDFDRGRIFVCSTPSSDCFRCRNGRTRASDHISVGEYTGTHVFTGGACRDRQIRTNVRV
mgnify:CR=1 FL=1